MGGEGRGVVVVVARLARALGPGRGVLTWRAEVASVSEAAANLAPHSSFKVPGPRLEGGVTRVGVGAHVGSRQEAGWKLLD